MSSILEARQRLPLRRLMIQNGDTVPDAVGGKKYFECPFCHKKCAKIGGLNGREFFKCCNDNCPSGTSEKKKAFDEVSYLAHRRGLSNEDAFKLYLQEAGVWKENTHAPSIMPGQKARKAPEPKETGEDEELVRNCIEVIKLEKKASVSLLQRRLRIGYVRASRILDEIERRGLIGPMKGPREAEPRDIFWDKIISPDPRPSAGPLASQVEPALQSPPANGGSPGVHSPGSISQNEEEHLSFDSLPAGPSNVVPLPGQQHRVSHPAGTSRSADGEGHGGGGNTPPSGPPSGGGSYEAPRHLKALREFYAALTLSDSDRDLIWRKRGLPPEAVDAFGVK